MYLVYNFVPPPPPPPKTYRVVSPSGTVTDIGDGSKGKPKQVGSEVEVDYNGEKIRFPGTLLKPGDPNPTPAPAKQGTMNGYGNFLTPGVALADANLFLQQPELADIFSTPIDLSYIQYDFNGTANFPVFQVNYTLNFTDGTADYIHIVPEPSSLFLLGTGVLGLGGFIRKRLFS